jgi:hypothetical protein
MCGIRAINREADFAFCDCFIVVRVWRAAQQSRFVDHSAERAEYRAEHGQLEQDYS